MTLAAALAEYTFWLNIGYFSKAADFGELAGRKINQRPNKSRTICRVLGFRRRQKGSNFHLSVDPLADGRRRRCRTNVNHSGGTRPPSCPRRILRNGEWGRELSWSSQNECFTIEKSNHQTDKYTWSGEWHLRERNAKQQHLKITGFLNTETIYIELEIQYRIYYAWNQRRSPTKILFLSPLLSLNPSCTWPGNLVYVYMCVRMWSIKQSESEIWK